MYKRKYHAKYIQNAKIPMQKLTCLVVASWQCLIKWNEWIACSISNVKIMKGQGCCPVW